MEYQVELDNLTNPDSKHFLVELNHSHLYLQPKQSKDYFLILLKHFRTNISSETGNAILHAFARVLSIKKHLHVFVTEGFVPALPITRRAFSAGILDVLHVLITRAPQCFDQGVCDSFEKLVRYYGKQCLVLISLYSQNFDALENPWPMLDILFNEKERFSQPDLVSQYVSLLSLLVRTFPEFRLGRGKHAWEVVCEVLGSDFSNPRPLPSSPEDAPRAPLQPPSEKEIVRCLTDTYNAACGIADTVRNVELPFEAIYQHLRSPDLASSALSLMMYGKMDMTLFSDTKFIKLLLSLASRSKKASVILMKLAENKEVAAILTETEIAASWMESEKPEATDTLRLFLVVFQNEALRKSIANLDSFYRFLEMMLNFVQQTQSSEILSVIGTIVRRLTLDELTVQNLSESGFIAKYFQLGEDLTDGEKGSTTAMYHALLLANAIGEKVYTRELRQMSRTIARIIKEDDAIDLVSPALTVATHLAKHRACAKVFADVHLTSDIRKKKRQASTKLKKQMEKFLRVMSGDSDE